MHEQSVGAPELAASGWNRLEGFARSPRVWLALAAAAAVAIVVWQLTLVGDYRVDDAYISFSFAKNLATGRGLTYGAGLKVEGYSNFLWTVAAAAVQFFAPDHIYAGARVLAFACFALTLWLAFKLSRRHVSLPWAFGTVVLLAFATDLTGAAQSGLESVPYTAALLATTYCYVSEDPTRRRSSGWCLLLLGLVRIDGMVHMAFFLGWTAAACLVAWRRPRYAEALRWLGPPLLLYAAYFGWRYHYYGLPLPTTYYAKSLIPSALPNRGFGYVLDAILQLGLSVAMLFAVFGLGRRLTCERLLLTALVTCQFSYVSTIGGDWMPFHRFLLPALPPLMVLFVWGLSDAWKQAQVLRNELRLVVLCALLGSMAFVIRMEDGHSIETYQERLERDLRIHVTNHTRGLVQASRLFRWVTRHPGEKLVSDYGGVFAYFTDADVIEMWGLCNKDIALRGTIATINPIYGKTCIPCYAEFQPTYFHADVPLARPVADIKTEAGVLAGIFQGPAIDKVVDFRKNFVAGRVVDSNGLAFYFIERKRAGERLQPRHPAPGIVVEYPFLASAP